MGWGGVPTGAGLVDGGGRPSALIPGEGSGKGWLGGVRGGSKASVWGGVGGRGTGPRDGANFAMCVVFCSF